jgi:hypothetical protein
VHQPRYRRDCAGELIQIDGSEHRWFEDRGPICTLLVYIDDATSRLMHLRFVASESTFAYFVAVFRVNGDGSGVAGDGMTQFGRSLHALNIEIICANSSQAKGRAERANRTLQDRLVKELRLAGISTIEAGNAFLPPFVADYNTRLAKPPANPKNLSGLRARPPPDCRHPWVTFLSGTSRDISIWAGQTSPPTACRRGSPT